MLQHTNGSHLEEGINTYLNNNNIGPLVQETIISHTRNALINNHHPRHQLSLATLRSVTARHKKGTNTPEADKDREKISFDYTLEAIQKMQEIGLSQETISAIIDSLYDLSLNYHNSREKIRSLGKITFKEVLIAEDIFTGKKLMGTKWYHKKDVLRNIDNNVGGDCLELAVRYRDIFNEKWLHTLINNELNDRYSELEIINGHDRRYFTHETANHVYCSLRIWKELFNVDPSLCEINIHKEWWYSQIWKAPTQISLESLQEELSRGEKSLIKFITEDKTISQKTKWGFSSFGLPNAGLVLWGFDDMDYIVGIRYAQLAGRKYPYLSLTNNDNKGGIFWILDINKELRIWGKNVPGRLKEKIKEHLLILDSITEYN